MLIRSRLPEDIAALRTGLLHGTMSVCEALAEQSQILANNDAYQCVTHRFEVGDPPSVHLPLAGVGLAHKDIFTMQGRAPDRGMGLGGSAPEVSEIDAPVVRRLKNKGGTLLAAVTMAEHACGATGENPNLPLPLNPVDPKAAVGGSSSGSAIAVAARLAYGSLGTDTAGSVRIPAATCGVVGFKPSRQYLSRQGMSPMAQSLDAVGILARTVGDVRILFENALSDGHREYLTQFNECTGALRERSGRIAVCLQHFSGYAQPTDEVQSNIVRAVSGLVGSDWDFRGIPNFSEMQRLTDILLNVETSQTHVSHLRTGTIPVGRLTRNVVLTGACIPATWYAEALDRRDALTRSFLSAFKDESFIVTPALPVGVPDWDEVRTGSCDFKPRTLLGLSSWTALFNYLDLPVIVVPIGIDHRNRPISVQIVGKPDSELALLRFAATFQDPQFN